MKTIRRKTTTSVSLSPNVIRKIDATLSTDDYSSQSDLVSAALTEFFIREEIREHEKKMVELYSVLVQHGEGRALLDEVPRTAQEKAEALNKAGIAHVEAGEYEEAKKCFAKAKSLESGQSTEPPKKRAAIDSQKEKEDCLKNLCPEPRELTPEDPLPNEMIRKVILE